jgi:hypothetical protein
MNPNEHIMTVTSMEYRSKRDGSRKLGQVIQLGVLQVVIDLAKLQGLASLPTGRQATYRDQAMAIEHGDLRLETREEDIPLVIPHFGPDPLKGFNEPLSLSDPSLRPWVDHLPLFFRELVAGSDTVKKWFCDRGGKYPEIHTDLVGILHADQPRPMDAH